MLSTKKISFLDALSKIIDNRGKTAPTAETGIPLIATNCISNNALYPEFKDVRYVDQETYRTWFRGHPEPGDVLFVNKGSPGRVCLVPDPVNFVIAQDMVALRVDPKITTPDFLLALIRSPSVQNQIVNMHVGTMIPHFKKGDFKNLILEFPDIKIQQVIGEIYRTFSDKIELNRQMNRTLEQMARALFKSWFEDFGPVRAKMRGEAPEGMDAETAALFPDELVEMEGREVPKGWTWQTVDHLYKLHGGSTPSTSNPEYWEGGEHHWSSPKDMSGLDVPFLTHTDKKITEAGTRVISSGILPRGTLLLSSRAPVGYMAIADMPVSINQGYIALEFTGPLGRYFTLNLLHSRLDEVKAMASGTTFPELSKKTFRQFEMLVPSSEVAAAFEGIVEALYGKLREGIYESAQLAQLRDALLPRLLSGEVDVGDWEAQGVGRDPVHWGLDAQ